MSSGFSIFVACSAIPLGNEAKLSGYCEELIELGDAFEAATISALV